jgi:hypothetical protein
LIINRIILKIIEKIFGILRHYSDLYYVIKNKDMENEMNFVLKVNGQYLILTSLQYEKWLMYGALPTKRINK